MACAFALATLAASSVGCHARVAALLADDETDSGHAASTPSPATANQSGANGVGTDGLRAVAAFQDRFRP
jgi:hypothetical protein